MKRFTAVRVLTKSMGEGDVGIFIGEGICKEAYAYDREGNLYLPAYEGNLSMALGVALCTNRRVFVYCDDDYFLRNLSDAAHIAISKCENLYMVVLVSGYYNNVGKHPTIYSSLRAPHAILFNMGFIVHNYGRQFKNLKNPINEIKATWGRIRGPLAVVLDVEYGTKSTYSEVMGEQDSIKRVLRFIGNEEIPNYKYVPPITFEDAFQGEE